MKTLSVVVITFALAACGGGKKKSADPAAEVMAQMQAARDRACACKDLACGEKVRADFKVWIQANTERLKKIGDDFKQHQVTFVNLSNEADECIRKLAPAAPPMPMPGAPPPSPTAVPAPPPVDPANEEVEPTPPRPPGQPLPTSI